MDRQDLHCSMPVSVYYLPISLHRLLPIPPPPCLNFAEFEQIARVTGMGFLVLGALGFIIKLVHIPVNNILMS